jgi:2-oxoisovalerate dehydrogenase E1 component alpha subunit
MPRVPSLANPSKPAVGPRDLVRGAESLSPEQCIAIHRIMVRSRAMEHQMIRMAKSGEGYFWIGGPGEEAFNTCLGLQISKGQGPAYDFLHLHYRNSATLIAMGMPLIDGIRQMAMSRTDPHSMGRMFPGHYAMRDWNVVTVSSVLEVRHTMAPGTAIMQKRHGGDGVTVVVGGEASTAEGDFASCMIWSSLPGREVPVLIIVMNNGWGVSTPAEEVHSEWDIIDRGKAFGIQGEVVDGNDVVASWHAIRRAMAYCRRQRRPYMIEAKVSRLYGHSSATGCQKTRTEADCIESFEKQLRESGILTLEAIEHIHQEAQLEGEAAAQKCLREAKPTAEDVNRFTYASSSVDAIYPDDYTGLPGE